MVSHPEIYKNLANFVPLQYIVHNTQCSCSFTAAREYAVNEYLKYWAFYVIFT